MTIEQPETLGGLPARPNTPDIATTIRTREFVQLLTAYERERTQLSRDIHNQLGSPLAALSILVSALETETAAGGSERSPTLRLMGEVVDQLNRDARAIAKSLASGPVAQQGLAGAGLVRALAGTPEIEPTDGRATRVDARLPADGGKA